MKTKKFIITYLTTEDRIVTTEENGTGNDEDEMKHDAICKAMEDYYYFKLVSIEETY